MSGGTKQNKKKITGTRDEHTTWSNDDRIEQNRIKISVQKNKKKKERKQKNEGKRREKKKKKKANVFLRDECYEYMKEGIFHIRSQSTYSF